MSGSEFPRGERIVASAFGSALPRATARQGNGSTDVPEPPAKRIANGLIDGGQLQAMTPPDALVKGFLYRNSLAMLYGASGVGKSFVALDLAMHVAHGNWWQRQEVARGSVLYVLAEGAPSFGPRLTAWQLHHQIHSPGDITFLPWPVNVGDVGWTSGLAEVVADRKPALVVFDTLARCIVGMDENSSRDIGRVVANLEVVRAAAGSCLLVVHHSGKAAESGARGSSALRAAMHTELEVTGDALRMTLKVRKQKDAPEGSPRIFSLKAVPNSGSVTLAEPGAEPELPPGVALTLGALGEVDVEGGVPTGVWRSAAGDIPERSFYRHRKALLDREIVINVGTDARPRYRPLAAIVFSEDAPDPVDSTVDKHAKWLVQGTMKLDDQV